MDRKQHRPHVEAQKCALLFTVVAFLLTHTGSAWRFAPSSLPGVSRPSIFQRADHYAVDRRLETRGRSDCLFRKLEDAADVCQRRRKDGKKQFLSQPVAPTVKLEPSPPVAKKSSRGSILLTSAVRMAVSCCVCDTWPRPLTKKPLKAHLIQFFS